MSHAPLRFPAVEGARRVRAATLESWSEAGGSGGLGFSPLGRTGLRGALRQLLGIVGFRFRALEGVGLARLWLVALLMLTQAGCLLGEAPEYQSRRQTPPVLISSLTDPSLNRVIRARTGESVEFKVFYRSEDAGDPMVALLFRDFRTDTLVPELLDNPHEFDPTSNLYPDEGDATQVLFTRSFDGADVGCHSYTLMLTHSSNLNFLRPRDETDVAFVTWWAAVQNQSGEPADILVDQCGEDQQ